MRTQLLALGMCVALGCAEAAVGTEDESLPIEAASEAGTAPPARGPQSGRGDGVSQDASTRSPHKDAGVTQIEAGAPATPPPTTPPTPPACTLDADCIDDGLACNGRSICNAGKCTTAPHPGCDDRVPCTIDRCLEPSGTCSHEAPDADGDSHRMLGCAGGDDCDDHNNKVFPGASETCDGVDNDCSTKVDDGAPFSCAHNSAPIACTMPGGGTGVALCNASCQRSPCQVPNDGCDNSAPLAPGMSITGSLSGAARETQGDCGAGGEVFYTLSLSERSLVYLDTFGAAADTSLSYRGTSCPGNTEACAQDSCGGQESQLALLLESGTHTFAVHSATGTGAQGFVLNTEVIAAAGGKNTWISGPGSFSGTTGSMSQQAVSASCGARAEQAEDAYYFTSCPGENYTWQASTCSATTAFDTVLHARGASGELACNDNTYSGCGSIDPYSQISFEASGPGLFVIYVDGFGFSNERSGPYGLVVTRR